MSEPNKIAEAFDAFTRTRLASPTLEKIWQQAYGADYAAEARPNAFYPQSVLHAIVDCADGMAQGCQLLEIGCGHGLAGRHLAKRLRAAHHCGIDISPGSIELAKAMAAIEGTTEQAKSTFWVADAATVGLDDESCAVIVCLDVLLYLSNKPAVMREIYRFLSPGGIFAFTTWEQEEGFNARLGAAQVKDYRPLLTQAGLDILLYEPVGGWKDMQAKTFRSIIDAQSELEREIGADTAQMWANMATAGENELAGRNYVFGIARRPS